MRDCESVSLQEFKVYKKEFTREFTCTRVYMSLHVQEFTCTKKTLMCTMYKWREEGVWMPSTPMCFVVCPVMQTHSESVLFHSLLEECSIAELVLFTYFYSFSDFLRKSTDLRRQVLLLYSWRFSRYSAPIHWLVHGHMTSNNETVSRQMP